jgi:hypothetical protein
VPWRHTPSCSPDGRTCAALHRRAPKTEHLPPWQDPSPSERRPPAGLLGFGASTSILPAGNDNRVVTSHRDAAQPGQATASPFVPSRYGRSVVSPGPRVETRVCVTVAASLASSCQHRSPFRSGTIAVCARNSRQESPAKPTAGAALSMSTERARITPSRSGCRGSYGAEKYPCPVTMWLVEGKHRPGEEYPPGE